jgi:endoglucanase
MKILIQTILVSVLLNTVCLGQSDDLKNQYLRDSLSVIQKRIAKSIIPSRYMEKKLIANTDTISGWEGITVSLYEYTVDGGKKTGRVYMANADSEKLATWVITTCFSITKGLSKKNTDFLIKSIRGASGGQFPVKGIVYEDMDGKGYFPYVFKNGVTVFLINKTIDNLTLITNTNIRKTGKYARIISTTRQEFNASFPNINTTELEWLNVVKNEYKSALSSDSNNLMIAWAKGKIK